MSHSVEKFQNSQWRRLDSLNFSKKTIIDLVKDGSVLDIGCGDGLLMEKLRDIKGLEVGGVDISSTAVDICKGRGLECIKADITESLPFKDNSFDNVLLIDVLEHLFQPAEVLREANRISRKYIYISVPNFSSLPARLQVLFGKIPENNTPRDGHVYWFNYRVLHKMLNDADLIIEQEIANTVWQDVPIIGHVMNLLKKFFPSVFGLSFIIKAMVSIE